MQAQFDYLGRDFPVSKDDASQICALQILADMGSGLKNQDEALQSCIEKYATSPLPSSCALTSLRNTEFAFSYHAQQGTRYLHGYSIIVCDGATVCRYITRSLLPARPREEWLADVKSRYGAMVGVTSEDAQLQFLNIMRCLPYGNSVFFSAKLMEDPTGLLPPNLALGINKRGIHFFRQQPKGYLYSAGLEDIMQFGSSAAVCTTFLKPTTASIRLPHCPASSSYLGFLSLGLLFALPTTSGIRSSTQLHASLPAEYTSSCVV